MTPWIVTDATGTELGSFATETEASEALLTGEYPENAEVAYVNEDPTGEDS